MDRRMKPLILLLLTALLCLTVEMNAMIVRMHAEHTKEDILQNIPLTEPYIYGNNGLWGIRTGSGREILAPEWYQLLAMSDDVLVAKHSEAGKYGLIHQNGETIVPFIYDSFATVSGENLWIGSIGTEDDALYHLYRGDGTLWSDTAWEEYSYEDKVLSLRNGETECSVSLADSHFSIESWHSVHHVGLHRLTMDLDAEQLKQLPASNVLTHLGDAAANYLIYLFVTPKNPPDAALLVGEDTSPLTISYLYADCVLKKASVRDIRIHENEGFPQYIIKMDVAYNRMEDGQIAERLETDMTLTVAANADGSYGYAAFYDPQTADLIPSSDDGEND